MFRGSSISSSTDDFGSSPDCHLLTFPVNLFACVLSGLLRHFSILRHNIYGAVCVPNVYNAVCVPNVYNAVCVPNVYNAVCVPNVYNVPRKM